MKSFSEILPEQQHFIQDSIDKCRFIYKLLCGLCTGCCIFYSLRPLYLNISIPTQIWWPYDVNRCNSIARYLAWFYCAYSGSHGVFVTSATDTLITGLVIHATGQIKILKDNLRFIEERAEKSVYVLSEPQRTLAKRKIIKRKLLHFAEHYNDIIEFTTEVDNLFSVAVFVQIIGSAVIICMMCYILTLVGITSVTGISFTVYVASVNFLMFFHCFFGNELKAESDSINEAIYMSNWYTYDLSSKKILVLIMERAKKPLVQSAANVMVLLLPLFVKVLKQAYSLMAVLQSQNRRN